jgi:pilus assembly protein CpaE
MEHRFSERFQRRDDETKGAGKALGFFSAKGGCGATTVICHVAAALGLQKQKVLLMDLDLDAGMVGFITKTSQVHSILDAVTNLDIHGWKALVSKGMPGVEIMASPLALASETRPTGEQVRHLLAFVKPYYDWTLMDLGRSLTPISMAALEECDEACLVTTLEVPALHQSKQITQTLLDRGFGKHKIKLILNRAPKRLDATGSELERMLGLPIFFMLPNDYPELYERYAEGCMLTRNSELGREIDRLAWKLAGLEKLVA